MKTSIPTMPPRAFFRREGGLMLLRRVYTHTHLPWYQAAITQLLAQFPGLPQFAAGVETWDPGTPAMVICWCQAGHAHLVTRALTSLDPQLGKASVISWPGALDITGDWTAWVGEPHLVAAQVAAARYAAAEVLR